MQNLTKNLKLLHRSKFRYIKSLITNYSITMAASIANLRTEAIQGKNIFLRAELNVPLSDEVNKEGLRTVTGFSRISAVIPTIQYLKDHGARCIGIFSHLGRPNGHVNPLLTLRPVATALSLMLGYNVSFVEHCIGEEVEKAVNAASPGSVILFENLRFHLGEEADSTDPNTSLQFEVFASALSLPFQIYVNDAFGSSHRPHASICGVTKFIPVRVAGLTMAKEIEYLKSIENPVRPFSAIIGGSKVSTKIDVLYHLLDHVNHLLIGGAMAFTFYRALGMSIGNSYAEEKHIGTALRIMEAAEHKNVKVTLASDVVVVEAANMKEVVEATSAGQVLIAHTVPFSDIPSNCIGLDIGRTSLDEFYDVLGGCKTILWNGPMGYAEADQFSVGTIALSDFLSSMTLQGATTIICGGDTVGIVEGKGLINFSHLSTGGGATLEYLEGNSLPGIDALDRVDKYDFYALMKTETREVASAPSAPATATGTTGSTGSSQG